MNSTHICSPLDPGTQNLEIRQATTKFEVDQLRAALNSEHYLKAGRPAGNTIWQGIYETGGDEGYPVLCAVLCWSGAALRLKDRDDWIDWDPQTRGSRLPLITQLRRFIVLESRRKPNLATRCIGLALRQLPAHFEQKYGYRPILAESFSDPQRHEGTVIKQVTGPRLDSAKATGATKPSFISMKIALKNIGSTRYKKTRSNSYPVLLPLPRSIKKERARESPELAVHSPSNTYEASLTPFMRFQITAPPALDGILKSRCLASSAMAYS